MRSAIVTIAFFLTIPTFLFSLQQSGTVKGTVVDYHTREPLPGAAVMISGTTLGASADTLGRFAIQNVPVGLHNV
jgi:hypothetical protein